MSSTRGAFLSCVLNAYEMVHSTDSTFGCVRSGIKSRKSAEAFSVIGSDMMGEQRKKRKKKMQHVLHLTRSGFHEIRHRNLFIGNPLFKHKFYKYLQIYTAEMKNQENGAKKPDVDYE